MESEELNCSARLLARIRLLEQIHQLAGLGGWTRDLDDDSGDWTEELARIYGLEGAREGLSRSQFLEVVHPDDRPRLQEILAELGTHENTHEVRRHRHRVVWPSGELRWVESFYMIEHGDDGHRRIIGASRDCTDEALVAESAQVTEQTLRISEQTYRNLFADAQVGIYRRTIADSTVIDVNPHLCALLGYGRERVLGVKAVHWWASPDEYERYTASLDEYGTIAGYEAKFRGRLGQDIHVLLSAHVYEALGYVEATVVDITARKQAEERLHAALREKDILLHELQHRVRNNLQVLSSLQGLQALRTSDPEASAVLQSSRRRINAMAIVHQMLDQSHGAGLDFIGYVRDLSASLLRSFGLSDSVRIEIIGGNVGMSLDHASVCGLLLNEIISNSLEHAFPNGQGNVRVELRCDGVCQLLVSDDGVGLPADFEQRRAASLGTTLIERMVAQLDGKLERHSSAAGTVYHIRFSCVCLCGSHRC